jgi:chromate transport protein ChrA
MNSLAKFSQIVVVYLIIKLSKNQLKWSKIINLSNYLVVGLTLVLNWLLLIAILVFIILIESDKLTIASISIREWIGLHIKEEILEFFDE